MMSRGFMSFQPTLFLLCTCLGNPRLKARRSEQRQNGETPFIVVNNHVRSVGWQRDVIWMWHRVPLSIGHPQREGNPAFHRRLNLLSRHHPILAQRAEARKSFPLDETMAQGHDPGTAKDTGGKLGKLSRFARELEHYTAAC